MIIQVEIYILFCLEMILLWRDDLPYWWNFMEIVILIRILEINLGSILELLGLGTVGI